MPEPPQFTSLFSTTSATTHPFPARAPLRSPASSISHTFPEPILKPESALSIAADAVRRFRNPASTALCSRCGFCFWFDLVVLHLWDALLL